MRTFHKMSGLMLGALLLAAACSSGDDQPVEIGEAGERPTVTTEATTTTEAEVTTTTLAPQPVDIPAVPEWGESWTGPSSDLGDIKMQEFNTFLEENAPDGVEPEEAVSVYLKLDPSDPNAQMLSGERGGPEATRVIVILNVEGDDSVRALRYEFVLERRARDAEEEATEEGEEAETGDTAQVADELDTNEGDAATDEQVDVVEGPDGIPWVLSTELTVQCQPGRGHQDFSAELCV